MKISGLIKLSAITICTAISIFAMSSCSQKQVNKYEILEKSNKPFETTGTMEYNDYNFDIRVVKNSDDIYELEILAPEPLNGMSFIQNQENFKVKYMGLAFEIQPSNIDINPIANSILQSINDSFNPELVDVYQEENIYVVKGENNSNHFELGIDISTGELQEIFIPDTGINVKFGNFSFLPYE